MYQKNIITNSLPYIFKVEGNNSLPQQWQPHHPNFNTFVCGISHVVCDNVFFHNLTI
jgi:hypothetical protein